MDLPSNRVETQTYAGTILPQFEKWWGCSVLLMVPVETCTAKALTAVTSVQSTTVRPPDRKHQGCCLLKHALQREGLALSVSHGCTHYTLYTSKCVWKNSLLLSSWLQKSEPSHVRSGVCVGRAVRRTVLKGAEAKKSLHFRRFWSWWNRTMWQVGWLSPQERPHEGTWNTETTAPPKLSRFLVEQRCLTIPACLLGCFWGSDETVCIELLPMRSCCFLHRWINACLPFSVYGSNRGLRSPTFFQGSYTQLTSYITSCAGPSDVWISVNQILQFGFS
jgi:hypothetical protein